MTKSVFRRFLFFSITITLICIIIICGVVAFPISNYIYSFKRNNLISNANNVSDYMSSISETSFASFDEAEVSIVTHSLDSMASSMHALVIVVDTEGSILHSTSPEITKGKTQIPKETLKDISGKIYFEHGTLRNLYQKEYYISAVPYKAGEKGETLGYCLVAQSTLWTSEYTPTIFGLMMIIIASAATLIFVLSTVYAYNTSRPLKQMAQIAKRFAIGDFEIRGHIKSNDEIGELASAFNEMADSLASSEGVRRNFIANVSHELKTPMTNIAGYIDGILDKTIPETDREYYLGVISQEIKRLNRLVTSMISLSKIDSGAITVNKAPFVIQDTLINVLITFEHEIEANQLSIEGLDNEDDIIAFGDHDLIHQVLYNLVENAVKFTPHGGYIRFSFTHKDNCVYVSIENSGEGILPEDLRLIFDKFYKADKSRSIDKKSMGLGLYIVRSIIQLHEGNITAESEHGKYCRFTFHIPDAPKKHKEIPETIKEEKDE